MEFLWRWMLVLLLLTLGEGRISAANTRQDRAFAAAQLAFDAQMWSRAESAFAGFAAKYPEAAATPMARLLQAQAQIKQGEFTNALQLLSQNQARAGKLADQYVNWMGEAEYANGDYEAAAATFNTLALAFTNSPLRLAATINAAAAWAQLAQWRLVTTLLERPDGVFQASLHANPNSLLVLRGQLLRAQSLFQQGNYTAAAAVLEPKDLDSLPPDLAWSWAYWLGQTRRELGDLGGSLSVASRLVQFARDARSQDRLATSLNLRAELYEKSLQTNAALADYEENLLNSNTPALHQRQAVLKIAGLLAAQNDFTNAEVRLDAFLEDFPHAPAAGEALFSLGDLHLKDYAARGSLTNLYLAHACLDQFLGSVTNADDVGLAYLDRGWCGWFESNYVAAASDFQAAVERLPRSADLAVAHFKLGDALFMVNDYSNALANYRAVGDFTDLPEVLQHLDEQALYQSLRVSEAMNYQDAANAALQRILKMYPAGDLADNAVLFFGESEANAGRPEAARRLFEQFVRQFPQSELLPQARLAIARSCEQEGRWPEAVTNYETWLQDFPTNELSAGVIYAAASARYHAGDETNALAQFTAFIARFPTNDLAPQAGWWVGDYFFRTANFVGAETNYENIFQNPAWKSSPLVYPAQFMAGRAAMGRNGYPDAVRYFSTLISDTNCPADLGVRARFACAAAWMQNPSADTNNPLANYATAISILTQIIQINPTNVDTAHAWGEIGNCDFQMNNFDAAENAYLQVFGTNAPAAASADVSARSAAMVGYGLVLEKRAETADGLDLTNLLRAALADYLDVFDMNVGKNLREGEVADPFWVKKAGLQALPLIQTLGMGNPDQFIDQLEALLPSLKNSLEKTRLNLAARK